MTRATNDVETVTLSQRMWAVLLGCKANLTVRELAENGYETYDVNLHSVKYMSMGLKDMVVWCPEGQESKLRKLLLGRVQMMSLCPARPIDMVITSHTVLLHIHGTLGGVVTLDDAKRAVKHLWDYSGVVSCYDSGCELVDNENKSSGCSEFIRVITVNVPGMTSSTVADITDFKDPILDSFAMTLDSGEDVYLSTLGHPRCEPEIYE